MTLMRNIERVEEDIRRQRQIIMDCVAKNEAITTEFAKLVTLESSRDLMRNNLEEILEATQDNVDPDVGSH